MCDYDSAQHSSKKGSAWRRLVPLFCGFLLVLMLEALMALFGVAPLSSEDPFVGFSGSESVFIKQDKTGGIYRLNPKKEKYFYAPQSFAMPKPEGTLRIVTLGGSTTYGRPYLNPTSFGAWLEKLYENYGPSLDVELLNAGGISYASYRAFRVMQETAGYDPDLFVIYSGHNEFLEARTFEGLREEGESLRYARGLFHQSRIYSVVYRLLEPLLVKKAETRTVLGDEVAAVIENIGGPELYHRDEEFRRGVVRQYRHTLQQMVDFAREKDVPLVLCTLPVNLSGLSPFKSEHRENLTREELLRWDNSFEQGMKAFAEGDFHSARRFFEGALIVDDRYALLHYRQGQTLAALGHSVEAYAAFDRAREEDIVPLRAISEFNDVIRDVATQTATPLADVEKFFRQISPGGIPGGNLFDDHVHPTIEGQQIIAWTVLDAVTRHGLFNFSHDTWQARQVSARQYLRKEYENVPSAYLARGQWGIGRLFFWAGKYEEAYRPLKNAWKQIRTEPEIPKFLGLLELSRGHYVEALEYLNAALQLAPDDLDLKLNKAMALTFSGAPQQALDLLAGKEWEEKKQSLVWMTRGQAMMMLGQDEAGVMALRKAAELAPDVASFRRELAVGLVDAGRPAEARQEYRAYLELSSSPDVEGKLLQWEKMISENQ